MHIQGKHITKRPNCPHCGEIHDHGVDFCPITGRPLVDVESRMVGRTIGGKYKLVRAIGQGGMGTIFEAEHSVIRNRVAVKLLHEPFAEKREPVQRLYREAKATGAIGHPNIIKVHDVGETAGGLPFLVMELLKGETLGDRIEKTGPLPLGFVIEVAIQMLSALDAAHRAGIIHRDLKSDNVFLLESPQDTVEIKIFDFGISKFVSSDMENLKLTQSGSVLGTPYYMSPEQASGKKDLDHRIDIYAAGVILYEALMGSVPHCASNYNALLIEIITVDIKAFRQVRPDVPEALESAILKATSRSRSSRWQSAREFLDRILDVRDSLTREALTKDAHIRRSERKAASENGTGDLTKDLFSDESGRVGIFVSDESSQGVISGRNWRRFRAKMAVSLGVILVLLVGFYAARAYFFEDENIVKLDTLETKAAADDGSSEREQMSAGTEFGKPVSKDTETIRISVKREPMDALVKVDEKLVDADGFDVKKSETPVTVTVFSPGFELQNIEVMPDADKEVIVKLERTTEGTLRKKGHGEKKTLTKEDSDSISEKDMDDFESYLISKTEKAKEVKSGGDEESPTGADHTDGTAEKGIKKAPDDTGKAKKSDGGKKSHEAASIDQPMDNPF